MVLINKTFRVFVSSTFSDLKEERNALQKNVFPKLRELCMQHGFRFQAIDLRWGVSEEAGLDQQTMKICLEEIERSQRVSPKPNFIILLGDRYGWRPLPYEISADEFEEIKKVVPSGYKDFLYWEGDELREDQLKKREGWYCRDDNADPPVYCLKPRIIDYAVGASDEEKLETKKTEAEEWGQIEARLRFILLNAIEVLKWDKDDLRRFKYEDSATEQEIIRGVFNPPKYVLNPAEHVFALFRNMDKVDEIPYGNNSKDFLDFEGKNHDIHSKDKLKELKGKIFDKLPSSNLFEYEVKWEGNGVSEDHLETLCKDVYISLACIIMKQIKEYEEKDSLDLEIEAHKEFGKDRSKLFIGREENRDKIKNYLANPNPSPFIVYGISGSGKSALMAKAVEDLYPDFYDENEIDNSGLIVRFIGANPGSSDIRSLLESLCRQITKIYGADDSTIPSEYNDLVIDLSERLKLATVEKPLFIFIDALDQLSDSENAHNIGWIPNELQENVHIVLSTLKMDYQYYLEKKFLEVNSNEVLKLDEYKGRLLLESWFKDKKVRRKLTLNQEEEVINKFKINGMPLYLKFAFEEARKWKSYSPVPLLESDIPGIIRQMFERLSKPENHGQILVSRSLGYLSAAKNGLTEDEILDILALDDEVFSLTKRFHLPTEEKLPVAIWSRLYFDLEPYLTEKSADGTSLLAFYHTQLSEVVNEEFLSENVKMNRNKLIAEYFQNQELSSYKNGEQVYNIRKVSEQPYQESYGELWDELEKTICDLRFVEAKCAVGMTYDLIEDYNLALDLHPNAQEEKQKRMENEEHVNKYIKDLIAFSEGKISKLDVIHSVKPWRKNVAFKELIETEKIKNDNIGRIINNPKPLDNVKSFSNFVNSQSHKLSEFAAYPNFCLQLAYNSANSGPVAENANIIIKGDTQRKLILSDKNWCPEYKPDLLRMKTLVGHTGIINAVAVTLDGKKAISGSTDKTVRVWDLETGKLLKTLLGHNESITSVAVTSDGKKAISGSHDGNMHIWDLQTGESLILEGHTGWVCAVAVSVDGKKVISGISDGTVRVWDLKSGILLKTLKGHIRESPRVHNAISDAVQKVTETSETNKVNSIAVTSDAKIVLSGNEDGTLCLWDIGTGVLLKTFEVKDSVDVVTVTADGKKAISGEYNTVRVWDMETKEYLKTWDKGGHNMAVTADGKIAITGLYDHTVRVWYLENGLEINILKGHTDTVSAVAVTADGKTAISGSWDKTLCVWDLESNIRNINHSRKVTAVCITRDGKKAISGTDEGRVSVWDLETGALLKAFDGLIEPIFSLTVTVDGKRAISGSSFGYYVCLYNLEAGAGGKLEAGSDRKRLKRFSTVWGATDTPDGRWLISWGSNLDVWDLESKQLLETWECRWGDVVAFTPDFEKAISRNTDSTVPFGICIWDLKSIKLMRILDGHSDTITAVAVTADGRKVISGSNDKTVRVWDLESGELLETLEFHKSKVNAVAATPDSKKVISGSKDGTVCVWDLENGKLVSFSKEDSSVNSIVVKDDSSFVLGCSLGNVTFSHLVNTNSGLPIITAFRMWLFGNFDVPGSWDNWIKADCICCGKRFKVNDEITDAIKEIETVFKKPDDSFSDEAWDDPRLIIECPDCHKKLKFNPFIVDNSDESFKIIDSEEQKNSNIKMKSKMSRWKFWK